MGKPTKKSIKPIDYEALRAEAKKKSELFENERSKMTKLQNMKKKQVNDAIIKKHLVFWKKESDLLKQQLKEAEREQRSFITNYTNLNKEEGTDLLENDLILIESLQSASEESKSISKFRSLVKQTLKGKNSNEIRDVLQKTKVLLKSQQDSLLELKQEEARVNKDLAEINNSQYHESEKNTILINRDGESEILGIDLPFLDDGIKESLIKELKSLDTNFEIQLDIVEKKLKKHDNEDLDTNTENGSISGNSVTSSLFTTKNLLTNVKEWDAEDAFHFVKIYKYYKLHLRKKEVASSFKSLCLERLHLEFPHKSISEIHDYFEWYTRHKLYLTRKKTLIENYNRERRQFIETAKHILMESSRFNFYQTRAELELIKEEKERKLKKLKFLSDWKETKLHEFLSNQEIQIKSFMMNLKKVREEEKENQNKRNEDHEKVKVFNDQQMDLIKKELLNEQMREKEIQLMKDQRKMKNQERVSYRQTLIERQQDEKRIKEEKRKVLIHEKMKRLESLKNKVEVESDPNRVLMATESSVSRIYNNDNGDASFGQNYGYNDDKITSDTRFKIQSALRNAGLLDTEYGRFVMNQYTPSNKARVDQFTTDERQKFKLNQNQK